MTWGVGNPLGLKFGHTNKWYMRKAESVLDHKILKFKQIT